MRRRWQQASARCARGGGPQPAAQRQAAAWCPSLHGAERTLSATASVAPPARMACASSARPCAACPSCTICHGDVGVILAWGAEDVVQLVGEGINLMVSTSRGGEQDRHQAYAS